MRGANRNSGKRGRFDNLQQLDISKRGDCGKRQRCYSGRISDDTPAARRRTLTRSTPTSGAAAVSGGREAGRRLQACAERGRWRRSRTASRTRGGQGGTIPVFPRQARIQALKGVTRNYVAVTKAMQLPTKQLPDAVTKV